MANLDPKYEAFIRKWRTRTRASERDIAESFMRGEALDAVGYGELPEEPGKTTIHVRVDGRGLDASADPPVIDDMIAEWQNEIGDVASDKQRKLTKDLIVACVAANRHTEERGTLILSAAVWLATGNADVLAVLRQGNCGLSCDFTFDDVKKERRLRIELLLPEGSST